MPDTPDAFSISIALACDLVGVSRQLRKTWIDRNLIFGRTSGDCSQLEVLELAAFGNLVDKLGFEDARLVWPQIRGEFESMATEPQLDLVIDLQLKRGRLARDEGVIGSLVRHGRHVRVIALGEVLTGVVARYQELAAILDATK